MNHALDSDVWRDTPRLDFALILKWFLRENNRKSFGWSHCLVANFFLCRSKINMKNIAALLSQWKVARHATSFMRLTRARGGCAIAHWRCILDRGEMRWRPGPRCEDVSRIRCAMRKWVFDISWIFYRFLCNDMIYHVSGHPPISGLADHLNISWSFAAQRLSRTGDFDWIIRNEFISWNSFL